MQRCILHLQIAGSCGAYLRSATHIALLPAGKGKAKPKAAVAASEQQAIAPALPAAAADGEAPKDKKKRNNNPGVRVQVCTLALSCCFSTVPGWGLHCQLRRPLQSQSQP